MANKQTLPNTQRFQESYIQTNGAPLIPTMDFKSPMRGVAGVLEQAADFGNTYTKLRYEGYEAQGTKLMADMAHAMEDAKDPCELEDIRKQYESQLNTIGGDDIFGKSYRKSRYFNNFKEKWDINAEKVYLNKMHDFELIQAEDTGNQIASTISQLGDPASMESGIAAYEASLAGIQHMDAQTKYKLMTNFYKNTVSQLYNSDPNKAVAWLDYAGDKYDGYGVDANEIRTKADNYNKAKQREADLDYKRSLAIQKQSNDIELGKLAAKIANGEAGVDDIKLASEAGFFTTNPFKEAEMYKALQKKESKELETPNFQEVRQLVRTNQLESIEKLVDEGIDKGLKNSEITNLVTLWKYKNPTPKEDKDYELKKALKNYNDGIETAEDNENLYFSGKRSKSVYEEIKGRYTEKEKKKLNDKKKELNALVLNGTLTQEYLDKAVENGLPADVALQYKNKIINNDDAIDKQLEEIDNLLASGDLNINLLRKKVTTKEYSKAAFAYGSGLLKEREEKKKAEQQAAKEKEKAIQNANKEQEKALQEQRKKEAIELKAKEKERKEKEEIDDFNLIRGLIDKGDITNPSQITVLETGGKPVNSKAASKAKKYLEEKNKEKDEKRKRIEQENTEKERKQKKQNFLDDYALARKGLLSVEDIRKNQIEGRYASQDDTDKLESAAKEANKVKAEKATEKKNRQAVNLQGLRDKGQQLTIKKSTTPDDYNVYITEVTNAGVNDDIDPKRVSELINDIAVPRMEANQKYLEQFGENRPFQAWDKGYFALKPFINEVLGKEKSRPKEGKSSAKERENWDKTHAQRAIAINNLYDLYRASLENLAKQNDLTGINDILKLDDERRTAIYNAAVENTKAIFTKSIYPDYKNDGQGTALISGNSLVRVGTPDFLPNGLKDNRFVSLVKSPSTGKFAVVLSDGTKKEITEEEYKRLGGN